VDVRASLTSILTPEWLFTRGDWNRSAADPMGSMMSFRFAERLSNFSWDVDAARMQRRVDMSQRYGPTKHKVEGFRRTFYTENYDLMTHSLCVSIYCLGNQRSSETGYYGCETIWGNGWHREVSSGRNRLAVWEEELLPMGIVLSSLLQWAPQTRGGMISLQIKLAF
jgi:hypothetical protein